MLTRNGEFCDVEVPEYPGRLTKTEYNAYQEALSPVKGPLCGFSAVANALSELEKQTQSIHANGLNSIPGQNEIIQDARGPDWHVHHRLFQNVRSDIFLCSRNTEEGKEFAVVEKFDPTSRYGKAKGGCEVHLTSNDPRLLLQDYVASEREMLQLARKDIISTVEEVLAERFPEQNLNRVAKALAARCSTETHDQKETLSQGKTRSVKIRL